MSALPIEKAIKLFHLLEYYLPQVNSEMPPLQFITEIVYNIKTTHNHRIYLEALALMENTTIGTIMETYTPEESLLEFSRGLQENQILSLREFCTGIGI
jgi:hypothetical protein